MLPLTKLANREKTRSFTWLCLQTSSFLFLGWKDPSGCTSWPAFFLSFLKQGLTHYVAHWLSWTHYVDQADLPASTSQVLRWQVCDLYLSLYFKLRYMCSIVSSGRGLWSSAWALLQSTHCSGRQRYGWVKPWVVQRSWDQGVVGSSQAAVCPENRQGCR